MKAEFFVHNREWLRQLFVGSAPIVICANGLLQRNSDVTYPFRQDSSFWYLTGVNEPDLVLVMDKNKEYIILPERETHQNIFDGAIDAERLSKISGIKEILDHKTGWKQLDSRVKKVKHIATLSAAPPKVDRYGFFTNPARAALIRRLKKTNDSADFLDLKPHLARMRAVKQPAEIIALEKAIKITSDTLKAVKKKLLRYRAEYEIEADITSGFRSRGASGHGFAPIVAGGQNACTIHYTNNNDELKKSELVVIDVGAEVDNYTADLTRTYAIGRPSKRQQAVYGAVLEVQQFAFDRLKPGILLADYEKDIEHFMGEKLRELHLIKSIEREGIRKYFPHGTSHFLGLDTHDGGDYEKPLEANMVLTVEPGIYIPDEGLGVRIEDDVILTTDGNKILSRHLPKKL